MSEEDEAVPSEYDRGLADGAERVVAWLERELPTVLRSALSEALRKAAPPKDPRAPRSILDNIPGFSP